MIMQDKKLHITAKAIYAYLASFAGAASSCYPSRGKICSDLGISGDTFTKYLKQLTDCGYLIVAQEKEQGRFSHNVYTLPDMISPLPIESDTEASGSGGIVNNNNSPKSNRNSKKNSPTRAAAGFDEFWAVYPKKKSKEAAKKAWDKLKPDEELRSVILLAVKHQSISPDWAKSGGQYIPYPATWLNNRRWEDDEPEQKKLEEWIPGENPFSKYLK